MSYKKRKYFVALIPALLQYLSISYSTKHASELMQPRVCGRIGNEINDHLKAQERTATPVLTWGIAEFLHGHLL
jgi:hypothetical protein